MAAVRGDRLTPALVRITADSTGAGEYFPEKYLCQWFREKQKAEVDVYCFQGCGVKILLQGYRALVEHLSPDTIILVDGGTDSLMRGDEDGLGTPCEDISSILAVNELDLPRKYLSCLGLVKREKVVKILGDEYRRRVRVEKINRFSAHADCNEMTTWLDFFKKRPSTMLRLDCHRLMVCITNISRRAVYKTNITLSYQ